jgi:glutamate N-acetyltransferase / amino-acid N-acetyltransferase
VIEENSFIHVTDGGVGTPTGFMAAGVHAGIKKRKKDIAVVYSKTPAIAVAAFTTNTVKAAPVLWSEQVIKSQGNVQAIIVNSGNANACTGSTGMNHAVSMAETAAYELNLDKNTVIVSSTGIIGVPLPIETVCAGIHTVCQELSNSAEASMMAAEAIMTTDTFIKQVAVSVEIEGQMVTIGGMAKGSGMIHPNMATMLSFITTDANISRALLDELLKETVKDSYNMISVDGDTSTNDMVVVLANGCAKNHTITQKGNEAYARFSAAFRYVNTFLAKQIVRDGEGASKVIEVCVTGAKSTSDAKKLVKSVITSNLVKTAFFGEDANWGRILAAMGYSGAEFDTNKVTISFKSNAGSILLMRNSEPLQFDETIALEILKESDIHVDIKLQDGEGIATGWGCDLSYEYVRINGDYRT